jgi:hypothetical protein
MKKLQLEIPLQSPFQIPTVAEMTTVITVNEAKKIGDQDLDRISAQLDHDDANPVLARQGGPASIGGKRD